MEKKIEREREACEGIGQERERKREKEKGKERGYRRANRGRERSLTNVKSS